MLDDSQGKVLLRTEPELKQQHARMARAVVVAFLAVLLIWAVADILFVSIAPVDGDYLLGYDLSGIALLGLVGLGSLWLIKKDRILLAGHILASSLFALTALSIYVFPQSVYLLSGGFLLSIMLAGLTVGDKAPYPYALLAIPVSLFAWFHARNALGDRAFLDRVSGYIFLLSQSVISLGLAVMLHSAYRYILGVFTMLYAQAERMDELARTDPLTCLANRRHFLHQLEAEIARARRYKRPLSLIFLDLDGFKEVNDRYGHIFGDRILQGVARSMQAVLRTSDCLARMGGDEFAVLLPETNIAGAALVDNRMRKAVLAFSQVAEKPIPALSYCAGITQLREDDETADDLLRRADGAQYRAKADGTGRSHADPELELKAETELSGTA